MDISKEGCLRFRVSFGFLSGAIPLILRSLRQGIGALLVADLERVHGNY
ncbi:hypothetical protein AB0L53_31840 [Nonomuraea sp. NPDC052129]